MSILQPNPIEGKESTQQANEKEKQSKAELARKLLQLPEDQLKALIAINKILDEGAIVNNKVNLRYYKLIEAINELHNLKRDKIGLSDWPSNREEQRSRFGQMGIGFDPDEYNNLVGREVEWTNPNDPSITERGVVTSYNKTGSFGGWEKWVQVKYPSDENPLDTASWKLKFVDPNIAEVK